MRGPRRGRDIGSRVSEEKKLDTRRFEDFPASRYGLNGEMKEKWGLL